jgi:hypothetical protein
MNQLILFCKKTDQAVFWDACKAKRCPGKCLFKAEAVKFGRDLVSQTPRRYSSLDELGKDLEKLLPAGANFRRPAHSQEPVVTRRTPVLKAHGRE